MVTRQRRNQNERKRRSARERAEQQQSWVSKSVKLPDGVNFFQVKEEGTRRIDILPFFAGKGNPYADPGEETYERTFWVHRGVGVNNDSYICLRKTCGKKCYICEQQQKMASDPDADDDDVKQLNPKQRQLYLLYDVKDRGKGLQVWDVSYHLFGELLNDRIKLSDEEDGYDFFFDLQEGLSLAIGFKQKAFQGNKFFEAKSIDFQARKKQYSEKLIKELPCLDDMLIIPSYDEVRRAFLQIDEEDEKSSNNRKRRRVEDEEEDDDDDRDSPEDLDDDDDLPDDEDDSIDDDEDEDEVDQDDSDEDEDEDDLDPEEEEEEEPKEVNLAPDEELCPACEGTGTSTSGRQCRGCGGEGKRKKKPKNKKKTETNPKTKPKPKPEPEEDDEEPEDDAGGDADEDEDVDDGEWDDWNDE